VLGPEHATLYPDLHPGIGLTVPKVQNPRRVAPGTGERTHDDPVPVGVPPERQRHLVLIAGPSSDGVEQHVVHACDAPDRIVVGHLHAHDVAPRDLDYLVMGRRLPFHLHLLAEPLRAGFLAGFVRHGRRP
ncbi:uncharacterized protein METZ01_LOCUS4632, partial [marine metagenome]